jgi:tRNA U55 pseudouridine synthase TruB
MVKNYIVLKKRVGETPLEALRAFQKTNPKYEGISLSYAGRLDPMAEGKLLVLVGEECKKQKAYAGLDKEYEVEVLLDIGSDTGDVLGITEYAGKDTRVRKGTLARVFARERGKHMRAYPAFSSKTVDGKPLFLHSLEKTVPYMVLPKHEERIYAIRLNNISRVPASLLAYYIEEKLARAPTSNEPSKALGADFRIKEVRESWSHIWGNAGEREFSVLSLRVSCGSGTYMRTLASRIGEALQTKALALSIKRTKIGTYLFGLWLRNYQ